MSRESAMSALTGTMPTPEAIPQSPGLAAVETPKVPDLQSTHFAQHAKKEAEIVRIRQEMKRERELMDSEKEKIRNIQKEYENYQTTKAKDPMAALKMLGFSEADIVNYLAGEQPVELTPEQRAVKAAEEATDARIKAYEEAQLKKTAEQQKQADDALIQQYRGSISSLLKTEAEKFEYCNYEGPEAEDLIYETVLKVAADSNGQDIMSPKEAAELVEQYYEERDKDMSSKVRKRNPSPAQAPVEAKGEPTRSSTVTPGYPNTEQPKPTITKTRTLHSGATSTVAASRQVRNETREQKKERLMSVLRGETVL